MALQKIKQNLLTIGQSVFLGGYNNFSGGQFSISGGFRFCKAVFGPTGRQKHVHTALDLKDQI